MKRIIPLLFIMIFMLSPVSALIKEVIDDGGKYPYIEIWNDAKTTKISTFRLVGNTENCYDNCEAVIKLDNYVSWSLPNVMDNNFKFDFKDVKNYMQNRNIDFHVYVAANNKTVQQTINYNCTGTILTENYVCNIPNNKTYSVPNYQPINLGSTVPVGVIYIKLTGKKDNPKDVIDWIPTIRNFAFNEWATWGELNLNQSLVGYWSFNTNWTNMVNPSQVMKIVYGNAGGSGNITNITYFKNGSGIRIDTTGYVHLASNGTNMAPDVTENFTIAIWHNATAATQTGSNNGFFEIGRFSSGSGTGFGLWRNANNQLSCRVNQKYEMYSGTGITVQYRPSLFVCTYNQTNVCLWANGTLDYCYAWSQNPNSDTTRVSIGCREGGCENAIGNYDEAMIWSRALTAGEIQNLYNNGTGVFWENNISGSPASPAYQMQVDLLSPMSNAAFNTTAITLVADTRQRGNNVNVTNVTFYYGLSSIPATWAVLGTNYTISTLNNTWVNYTFTSTFPEGNYTWNAYGCSANATYTNCTYADMNFTFIVDQTTPKISFVSPANGTQQVTISNTSTFNFNYTITETNPGTCWYYNTTANVTLASCGTNFTIPLGNGYKKIILYINDSAGNTNQTEVTVFVNRVMPRVSYRYSITESTFQQIFWNVTADLITTINGTLKYNGVNYPMHLYSNNGTDAQIYSNLTSPVLGTTSYFNITYAVNNFTNYSSQYQQNISTLILGLCNATNTVVFANYSLYNATSPYSNITATFSGTFWYASTSNSSYAKNISIQNVSGSQSYPICLSPTSETFYVTSNIVFGGAAWHTNTYYDVNSTWNNVTTNISLYLLSIGLGTTTIHTVKTNSQEALDGYYLKIYIYDAGTNTYKLFAVLKTNNDGQDTSYLNWYDTFYKYVITDGSGTSVYSTDNTKVFASPKTFIITDTSSDIYGKFYGVVSSVYWYNNTRNVSAVFSDPNGNITGGCLRVIRMHNGRSNILTTTCINATSGNINYTIAAGLNGTYWGVFYATGSVGWIDSMVHFGIIDYTTDIYTQIGNLDGSFFAFIIIGTAAFIGIFFGPVIAILFTMFGVISSFLLGFVSVNDTDFIAAVFGLGAVGGYLIYKLRT